MVRIHLPKDVVNKLVTPEVVASGRLLNAPQDVANAMRMAGGLQSDRGTQSTAAGLDALPIAA